MKYNSLLVGISLVLSGCAEAPPMIWPDYCKMQNRKIPAEERYRDVLLDILAKRTKYAEKFSELAKWDPRYKDQRVHFFQYYDRLKAREHKLSDQQIATRYVKDYPECCSQHTPTYLREGWELDSYVDSGPWAVDVRIWRRLPQPQMPSSEQQSPDQFVRKVDGCDQEIRYESGINGIYE